MDTISELLLRLLCQSLKLPSFPLWVALHVYQHRRFLLFFGPNLSNLDLHPILQTQLVNSQLGSAMSAEHGTWKITASHHIFLPIGQPKVQQPKHKFFSLTISERAAHNRFGISCQWKFQHSCKAHSHHVLCMLASGVQCSDRLSIFVPFPCCSYPKLMDHYLLVHWKLSGKKNTARKRVAHVCETLEKWGTRFSRLEIVLTLYHVSGWCLAKKDPWPHSTEELPLTVWRPNFSPFRPICSGTRKEG